MKKIDFARNDDDLYPLLQKATDSELAILADTLADKMSADIDKDERDPLKLTIELQSMGGDSVINLFRRRGVQYREILDDVADKLSVKNAKNEPILKIEELVAEKLIENFKKKLSEQERKKFEQELKNAVNDQDAQANAKRAAAQAVVGGVAPVLVAIGGFMLQRGAIVAIPGVGQVAGLIAAVAGGVVAFSGTAYSVTVPSVLIIGVIRARIETEKNIRDFEL